MSAEHDIWSSGSSQVTNIGSFISIIIRTAVLCGAVYYLDYLGLIEQYLAVDIDITLFYAGIGCFSFILFLWSWLTVSMIEYKLTVERLTVKTGVLNRITDELELYRVKDYTLDEPLISRIFGLSNVVLQTSDTSHPTQRLEGIEKGSEILAKIRQNVEEQRRLKGVRELDV